MAVKGILLFLYGLLLSAVIGVIAAAFLILEGAMTGLVWTSDNQVIQTILIIAGSIILYYLLKRWPELPQTAHDSISELKANQTIDYQDVFYNLLITLVILIFGAGVGPEAALLSTIISLSIWQADNLRYFYFHYDELKELSIKTALAQLLNPFKYRQRYDETKAVKIPTIVRLKKLLYLVFIINGLVAFSILLKQTDQPSFILKLGQSHWQLAQLKILPVLVIGSYLLALACKVIYNFFCQFMNKINLSLMTRVFLGALGIIIVMWIEPNLLFSGQHSLHLLIDAWSNKSPLFLMGMAILKLALLAWCLNFNWRGGDIFPITFATMTLGFAAAAVLPQYDNLFVVTIVATAVMSELSSPIVAGIFLLFFFPLNLSPIIVLVAALFFLKNKYMPKLNLKINNEV